MGGLALEGQHIQGVAGENSNGRGAPDPQGGNGLVEVFRPGELQIDRLVGKPTLI